MEESDWLCPGHMTCLELLESYKEKYLSPFGFWTYLKNATPTRVLGNWSVTTASSHLFLQQSFSSCGWDLILMFIEVFRLLSTTPLPTTRLWSSPEICCTARHCSNLREAPKWDAETNNPCSALVWNDSASLSPHTPPCPTFIFPG